MFGKDTAQSFVGSAKDREQGGEPSVVTALNNFRHSAFVVSNRIAQLVLCPLKAQPPSIGIVTDTCQVPEQFQLPCAELAHLMSNEVALAQVDNVLERRIWGGDGEGIN